MQYKSYIARRFELNLWDPVDAIVAEILEDVTDRRGWRQEWDGFDFDGQREIVSTWKERVAKVLSREKS